MLRRFRLFTILTITLLTIGLTAQAQTSFSDQFSSAPNGWSTFGNPNVVWTNGTLETHGLPNIGGGVARPLTVTFPVTFSFDFWTLNVHDDFDPNLPFNDGGWFIAFNAVSPAESSDAQLKFFQFAGSRQIIRQAGAAIDVSPSGPQDFNGSPSRISGTINRDLSTTITITYPSGQKFTTSFGPSAGGQAGSLLLLANSNRSDGPHFFDNLSINSVCQVNMKSFAHQAIDLPQQFFGPPQNKCQTSTWGCALMTYSNMLRSFDNPFLDDSPPVLDVNLLANSGYSGCSLLSKKIPQSVGFLVQPVQNLFASFAPGTIPPVQIDDFIDQHFCQKNERVVLVLDEFINGAANPQGPHYVLVTAKKDNDWEIADPGWTVASPQKALSSLQDHYAGFTTFSSKNPAIALFRQFTLREARAYASSQIANPLSLNVTAFSPLELLLTDAQARKVGFSPQSGASLDEIPNGTYSRDRPTASDDADDKAPGDPAGIKTIYLTRPQPGIYRVDAFGTALGTYTLQFEFVDINGTVQQLSFLGLANAGSQRSFQVQLSPDTGVALSVVRGPTTFRDALDDINSAFQLGLIDNQGIATSLSQKLQAAVAGSARTDILNAFINEVNAQSDKHIRRVAATILLEDANSLITQSTP